MSKNQEWVGGKQVYSRKNTSQNSATDNWLDRLSDEDFGFGGCGFKPKKNSFKVENSEDKEQK